MRLSKRESAAAGISDRNAGRILPARRILSHHLGADAEVEDGNLTTSSTFCAGA